MKFTPRKSAAQWAELVAQCQASGESEQEFCERKALVLKTFRKWRYRYSNTGRGTTARRETQSAFVRVVTPARMQGIVVHVGAEVRIECPGHMDIESVAQLVRTLCHGR